MTAMIDEHHRASASADRRSLRTLLVGSGMLILVAGALFYSARGEMGMILDRSPSRTPEPVVLEPEDVEPQLVPPPTADRLSEHEIAQRNERVVVDLEALVGAGLSELPDFAKLSSGGEVERKLFAARWRAWRRIWLNRVGVVEGLLVPVEQCDQYRDHTGLCLELSEVTNVLRSVAGETDVKQAEAILDQCAARVEAASSPDAEEREGSVAGGPEGSGTPEQDADEVGNHESRVGDDRSS